MHDLPKVEIPDDATINALLDEAVEELLASGEWRDAPCRACGEVTFFTAWEDECCFECWDDQRMMRDIALFPDRYCAQCDMVQTHQGFEPYGAWRADPTCLACGEAGYFPTRADGRVPHLCLRCEATRTFEEDPFCAACGTIARENLDIILACIQRD